MKVWNFISKAFLIKGPQQFCTELQLYNNQQENTEEKNLNKKKSDELYWCYEVFEDLPRPQFTIASLHESLGQDKDDLPS